MKKTRNDFWAAMGFLGPNLAGFLVFIAGPVLFSLGASFTDWDLGSASGTAFNGAGNFVKMAKDTEFWLYLINTVYMMLGLPVAIIGSLMLAMLLNREIRGMTVYRTFFYLPTFTSGVALMILWKALYNPDFGPINETIRWISRMGHLGLHPPEWLSSTHNLVGMAPERLALMKREFGLGARDALVIMGVWIAIGGNNMLLYLAALTNIPRDLYEAAEIDGAGKWAAFWNVTWPQLAPTTFFIVVISVIGGLQGGFEQARVMTEGKPAGTTVSLTYYIYRKAFEQFQMGYASAIAWVLFTIILVVTLLNWRFGQGTAE